MSCATSPSSLVRHTFIHYSGPSVKPKRGRPYSKNHPERENRLEDVERYLPILCEWPAHGVNCPDTAGHNPWECPTTRPCGTLISPTCDSVGVHFTNEHQQGLPSGTTETRCRIPDCNVKPIQRSSLGRHITETHYELNKLTCLWCGDKQRRSAYHDRHGVAERCPQRPLYISRLAFAATPDAFKQDMDVLLERGGNILAIAELLFGVEQDPLWIGWLFWSAYAVHIFHFLPAALPPLPSAAPPLAAGPSQPGLVDQETIPT